MSIQLHILNSSGRLDPYKVQIETATKEIAEAIEEKISLPEVDIVIADNPDEAIEESGTGGMAYTPNFLLVSINPDFQGLKNSLTQEIKSTLAHELHHCARMQSVGYGKTLLDALVTEGLADHFDMEINGGEAKPWCRVLQSDELERIRGLALSEYKNENYSHSDWFFGSEERSIPKWSGYSLGFQLVEEYLTKSGKKASELANIPSEEILN